MSEGVPSVGSQGRFKIEPRLLRVALFVLTALSLAAALFLEPPLRGAVARGALGSSWLYLPLGVYGFFFVAYCIDRWMLVRRRGYPAGRAAFQLVFGLLFALLLVPSTSAGRHGVAMPPAADQTGLLASPRPEVRRAAVEAMGFRGPEAGRMAEVLSATMDPDLSVRAAAFDVLHAWSGVGRADVDGLVAWGQRYLAQEGRVERQADHSTEEGH